MKFWHHKYAWDKRTDWALPNDEEMMQAQLVKCLDSQVDAVMKAIIVSKGWRDGAITFRTCVQAGGAFGLYPLALSTFFNHVITFEPLLENLQCMAVNIGSRPDITVEEYPLWHTSDRPMSMTYSKKVKNSYGAHHVGPSGSGQRVTTVTIDQYSLHDVDLIWLDIEGAELHALRGAEKTIARCRPVVVVEDRTLPQMRKMGTARGDAVRWMCDHWNYRRSPEHCAGDVILVPNE